MEDSKIILSKHCFPVTRVRSYPQFRWNIRALLIVCSRHAPTGILVICMHPDISGTQPLCFLLGCAHIGTLRDMHAIILVFTLCTQHRHFVISLGPGSASERNPESLGWLHHSPFWRKTIEVWRSIRSDDGRGRLTAWPSFHWSSNELLPKLLAAAPVC